VPYTGLTGADSLLSFARVNVLVCSLLPCVVVVSSLVHFGAREVRFVFWGFLAIVGVYAYQTSFGLVSGQVPHRSQGTLHPSNVNPRYRIR
jgi:hypothetical protein